MLDLSFKKFTRELNERRFAGPQSSAEFKKLSPKMKTAVLDSKTSDPIISKIDGIIKVASKKHGVSTYDIEDYFDNELIK